MDALYHAAAEALKQAQPRDRFSAHPAQTCSPVAEERSLTRVGARCTHVGVDDKDDPQRTIEHLSPPVLAAPLGETNSDRYSRSVLTIEVKS